MPYPAGCAAVGSWSWPGSGWLASVLGILHSMSMIRTITVSLARSRHASVMLGIEDVAQPVPEHVEGQDDREDRQPGVERHPGRLRQIALRGVEHAAPRWRRRLLAEPQERQAGLGDDRSGHREARLDQERRQQVGKKRPHTEAERRAAERARGLDVLLGLDRED